MCGNGCSRVGPGQPAIEGERDFEGLVAVEKLERSKVRGMLREVQEACYARDGRCTTQR